MVRVIPSNVANPFVRRHHYSGKVVNNSCLHFGAFLDGRMHGVMSYGPSMDKRKLQGLVEGTPWSGFIELNRMAFDDVLPRNSESRCIGITAKMIRKQAPQVKWIVSFADGCQCGDGAIYRASGFLLTGIRENENLAELPDGTTLHKLTAEAHPLHAIKAVGKSYFDVTGGKYDWKGFVRSIGGKIRKGYQLRYIKFLDPSCRDRLTVPVIPFSKIDELGAGMYKGQQVTLESRHH